ncbi:MAG: 2-amino-4-hydroxy-6-hydroxymethyldihydropteridine diphosphokinase [Caldithrix sp.]|nr:2-amino-4-hydroxy-6-hydroxymethyldihydropteridine diphosphokinase [Caldithrix sp.]
MCAFGCVNRTFRSMVYWITWKWKFTAQGIIKPTDMHYFIGLGSNKGDRLKHLSTASEQMKGLGRLLRRSSIYETEPYGITDQNTFLNAVLLFDFSLCPFRVIRKLKSLETRMGRTKNIRWGSRVIDLDIIDYAGQAEINTEVLTLPHCRMSERNFVLYPLQEIAPDYRNRQGVSIEQLIKQNTDQSQMKRFTKQW